MMLLSTGAVYPPRMTLLFVAVPLNFATACVAMVSASLMLMGTEVFPIRTVAVRYDALPAATTPNVMVLLSVNVGIAVLPATVMMALVLVLNHRMCIQGMFEDNDSNHSLCTPFHWSWR